MRAFRRTWFAFGLAVALGAAGCSKPSAPVVQAPPVVAATDPAAPISKIEPTTPAESPDPVVKVAPKPDLGPMPTIRPTIPSPLLPVVEPKPEPPKVPVVALQPPVPKPDPVKPADPPKPVDPPKPAEPPKKIEYPTVVEGKTLPMWLAQLSAAVQPDSQQREAALRTLPQFGPDARKPAIAPITNLIHADPDPGVRIVAITIISNMGFDIRDQIKPAVSALRTCMLNTAPGSIVRLYCIRSLMSFGQEAVAAIPEIKGAGSDPSWETRQAVATALGRIGAPASEKGKPSDLAAKYLLNTLMKDPCTGVRLEAIQALLTLGPPKADKPEEYIKAIKDYLEPVELRIKGAPNIKTEQDKGVLCWLYLLNIMYDDRVLVDKEKDYLKKIAGYIKYPDSPIVRLHAINACAALGPQAAPVVQQLADALGYPEPELVIAAMSALAQIGPAARGILPELEKIKAGSKDPVKPADAPKDWKPDQTLRLVADDAIQYITGKKKLGDPEPKKEK